VSKKNNLIAGIILICLIGIYVALKSGILEPEIVDIPNDYELSEAIFESEKDDIIEMQITNSDGSFSFKKDGEDWICQEKPEIELEQGNINSLSWDYITLKPNKTIEEQAANLEPYGLQQPQASIHLILKNHSEITFLLGNQVEGGGGYYFMEAGKNTVYLMGSLECNNLLHPLSYYRKSMLFSFAEESVKNVFYQVGGISYKIKKIQQQQWKMTEPYEREVYALSFSEQFLTPALQLTITEFYDELTADKCGLNQPTYQLQISAGDESDVLLIGDENESGHYYAKWKNKEQIFGIQKDSLAFLEVSPLNFMQSYVYLPQINTVESFIGTIQGKEFSMLIERIDEETNYYFNGEKVESELWKEKFQILLTAEIIDFANEAKANGEPIISYTAKLTDGTETKIAFYPLDERNYAVAYNDDICFIVNKNSVDTIIENF